MKLYMLTTGDYSDYRVLGIYDSKEKAEKAIEYLNIPFHTMDWGYSIPCDVREMELNPASDALNEGLFVFKTVFKWDGNHVRCGVEYEIESEGVRDYMTFDKTKMVEVFCYARNIDIALKIASEKFAQFKYEESQK